MELCELYARVGGDYQATLQRLQSKKLIVKYLQRFENDPSFVQLKHALEGGDLSGAFLAVHTLKGVAATLGLTDLATAAGALTEQLRGADTAPQEEFVYAVSTAYNAAIGAIRQLAVASA